MAGLNVAREKLLARLVAFFGADNSVCGLFLGGSLADGNADQYSDIDFRVVLRAGQDKENFLSVLTEWPDLLFVETLAHNYAVLHFDSFVKLDVFIYEKAELVASPWLKGIKIFCRTREIFCGSCGKARRA